MSWQRQQREFDELRRTGMRVEEAAERVGLKLSYGVQLNNGQEAYGKDRAEAEAVFQHCAAVGHCALIAIAFTKRFYLANSILQRNAPTLGHYEQATWRAKAGRPVYSY